VAAVEKDGARIDLPRAQDGPEFLAAEDLARIKRAMAAVVSRTPGSTGRHVAEMIEKLGFAPGVIAGKTGTSVRTLRDGSRSRTASFAGFAPVDEPRFVAFCVLQKDRAEGFYGGRYAAQAASRLLLHALGVLDPVTGAGDAVRTRPVRAAVPGRSPSGAAGRQVGR
jgi:cell division protein FtsI (penicillin-binding protein 3)